MSHKKKEPIIDPTVKMKVAMPTKISSSVAAAMNSHPGMPLVTRPGEVQHLSWYDLEELRNDIRDYFMMFNDQFTESVEMVKAAGGVERVDEYNRTVVTACNDIDRFSKELAMIMTQHEGRNGVVDNAEDHNTYMTVFEKYQSFMSHFQASLHHVMIAMKGFSMEADARRRRQAEVQPEVTNQP